MQFFFHLKYLITNLGISEGFGDIDTENLKFPATMLVDYIRVYQRKDAINTGCDPTNFPTQQYIDTYVSSLPFVLVGMSSESCRDNSRYKEAYANSNLTVWADYKQPWPKNRLNGGCT